MGSTLTSRERVLKVLNHEKPDRVPIDLGATINSSIVNIVRNYSLFGIICCTLSWIVIEYIYDEINRTESYYKHIIQDLHTKIVRVHLGLFILLFIVFILYVLL